MTTMDVSDRVRYDPMINVFRLSSVPQEERKGVKKEKVSATFISNIAILPRNEKGTFLRNEKGTPK
jgi:hypothetical protein